jgi:hypothetical protein
MQLKRGFLNNANMIHLIKSVISDFVCDSLKNFRFTNKFKSTVFLLVIGLFFFFDANIHAATISFQNKFYSKRSKQLIKGTYPVTANIYSEGQKLWTESFSEKTFNNGSFYIILGNIQPVPSEIFCSPNVYLSLSVQGEVATFSMTAVPRSISAVIAEEGLTASADVIQGSFVSTVNMLSSLIVDTSTFIVNPISENKGSVGIGVEPEYTLDVSGLINSHTNFYQNGEPLTSVMAWRRNTDDTENIYYQGANLVGIGTDFARHELDVVGTINAEIDYFIDGQPLSASMYWKETSEPTTNTFIGGDVGIGVQNPKVKLHVRGALRIASTNSTTPGTIRYSEDRYFEGYTEGGWASLMGITGFGEKNKIAFWEGTSRLEETYNMSWSNDLSWYSGLLENNQNALNIGDKQIPARLGITFSEEPALNLNYDNVHNALFIAKNGYVGIGTITPNVDLEVRGTIDATDFLIEGDEIRLRLSKGTYWRLNPHTNSIYYKPDSRYYSHPYVGIGRPDPGVDATEQSWGNVLEIAAPYKEANEPTKDPAITFTDSKENVSYTIGVDADREGVFRVELGNKLGDNFPLMAIKEDHLGIGMEVPLVNLGVSGNKGMIMTGQYLGSRNVVESGPGTKLYWLPSYGAFRVGRIDQDSSKTGLDWDQDNLGEDTIVMGYNNYAEGVLSVVSGGENNQAKGIYVTIPGGKANIADGYSSFAAGYRAQALHHGSFVWGDNASYIAGRIARSQEENQFLVFASGGVGIGTNKTRTEIGANYSSLTLGTDSLESTYNIKNLLELISPSKEPVFYLTASGNMAINATDEIKEKLVVMEGPVGIETTTPAGWLEVLADNSINPSENGLAIYDYINKRSTPSMVVSASKNIVSIGMYPNLELVGESDSMPTDGFLQIATGTVLAEFYEFPDGGRISTAPPTYFWVWNGKVEPADFKTEIEALTISNPTENLWAELIDKDHIDDKGRIKNANGVATNLNLGLDYVDVQGSIKDILDDAYDNKSTPNIYYDLNYVGIGTNSPNNLLEISNFGSEGLLAPMITFDIDGIDRYSFGMNKIDPSLKFVDSTDIDKPYPQMVVSGNNVGFGTTNPIATFHDANTAIFDGLVRVNTQNNRFLYKDQYGVATGLFVTANLALPTLNVFKLFVQGEELSAGGVKWSSSANHNNIWYETLAKAGPPPVYSYVGVGTRTPNYDLEIIGTASLRAIEDGLYALRLKDRLIVDNTLTLESIFLNDQKDDSAEIYSLDVKNNNLYLNGFINVSEVFSRSDKATSIGGNLSVWDPDSARIPTVSETSLYWDNVNGRLSGTYNIYLHEIGTDTIEIDNEIQIGTDALLSMVDINSAITKDDNAWNASDFNSAEIDIKLGLKSAPSSETAASSIKGLYISMDQPEGMYLTEDCSAIGVYVDVTTDVKLTSAKGDPGHKYAAIFMTEAIGSANVGIGCFPQTDLDVAGTILATDFIISSTVSLSTLNVKNSMNVLKPRRIGINVDDPNYEIEVGGDIYSEYVHTSSFESGYLSASNKKFVVTQEGAVGIGTTIPEAQLEIKKYFSDQISNNLTVQSLEIVPSKDVDETHNLIGLDIAINSAAPVNPSYKNILGSEDGAISNEAVGLKIDMSGLLVTNNMKTGLHVKVPGLSYTENTTANAAIFLGGNIGIGISNPNPAFAIDVIGDMRAINLHESIKFNNSQEAASFNYLYVSSSTANTTVGGIFTVKDLMTSTLNFVSSEEYESVINRLFLDDFLNLKNIEFIITSNESLVVTSLISSVNIVDAANIAYNRYASVNVASFNSMGIGRIVPYQGLSIDGAILASALELSEYLVVDATSDKVIPTININNILFSDSNYNVGVGKTQSLDQSNKLYVMIEPSPNRFIPEEVVISDNRTWNAVRIEAKTTTKNHGSGITLAAIPDSSTSDDDAGCHIVALRGGDVSVTGSSYLVFYTDPNDDDRFILSQGKPTERLRITTQGDVGIGTINPSANLHVLEGSIIENNFKVLNKISVGSIIGDEGIFVGTTLNIEDSMTVQSLGAKKNIAFLPTTSVLESELLTDEKGVLFVNANDSNKIYYATNLFDRVVSADLRENYTGSISEYYRVPYYSSQNILSATNKMSWLYDGLDSKYTFQIENEPSNNSGVKMESFVGTSTSIESFTNYIINLGFEKTELAGEYVYAGVSVNLTGGLQEDVNEKAVGLAVDMHDSLKAYTPREGGEPEATGVKYAAIFLSDGNTEFSSSKYAIGIATSANVFTPTANFPAANFHVSSNINNQSALHVVSDGEVNSLIVSQDGKVGIRVLEPSSRLTVRGSGDTEATIALKVINSDDEVKFVINNGGKVGIGFTEPSTHLVSQGSVTGNGFIADSIKSNTIAVNSDQNGFIVRSDGYIGLGITAPSDSDNSIMQLESKKGLYNVRSQADYKQQTFSVVLDGGSFNFERDITGLDMQAKSADDNSIYNKVETVPQFMGLKVDLSELILTKNAKIIGFKTKLKSDETPTNNAAIFYGGYVGIGLTQPSYMLDIDGAINADFASINTILLVGVENATINNSLIVDGDVQIGSLLTDSLIAIDEVRIKQKISGVSDLLSTRNSLVALGIVSANVGFIESVGIATNNIVVTLNVAGDASISGTLNFSGELKIATINALASTINAGSVYVQGLAHVSNNLQSNKALFSYLNVLDASLDENGVVKSVPGYGLIYENKQIASSEHHLFYSYTDGAGTVITANISKQVNGTPGRIPFYGSNTILDSLKISWATENFSTTINTQLAIGGLDTGTTDHMYSYTVSSSIPADYLSDSDIAINKVYLEFPKNRLDESTAIVEGVAIDFINEDGSVAEIGTNEKLYGLFVDVSNLKVTSNHENGAIKPPGYKYAATFLGEDANYEKTFSKGNVGIWVSEKDKNVDVSLFRPSANLHINTDITQTGPNYPLFKIENNDDIAMIVTINSSSKELNTGIGLSEAYSRLSIKSDISRASASFEVYDNDQEIILWVNASTVNTSNVGIGTKTPTAKLHVANTGTGPVFKAGSLTNNMLVIDNSGNIGYATETPLAKLHLVSDYYDDGNIFQVGSGTTENMFSVSATGNLGFETISYDDFNISVSGNILLGVSSINRFLINTDNQAQGIYFAGDKNFTSLFGLIDDSPVIKWAGGYDQNNLILESPSGELLRFTKDGVGKNIELPSANFHIKGEGQNDIFEISTATTQDIFIIDKSGNVGINKVITTANLYVMDVNSSVTACIVQKIIDAPFVGSLMTLPENITLNVVQNATPNATTPSFIISHYINCSDIAAAATELLNPIGSKIEITLKEQNTQKPMMGSSIRFVSSNYKIDVDKKAFGLLVDVGSVSTLDASAPELTGWGEQGHVYAASFMGAPFGVGVEPVPNVELKDPNGNLLSEDKRIMLQVVPMYSDENMGENGTSGNVALFEGDTGSKMIFQIQPKQLESATTRSVSIDLYDSVTAKMNSIVYFESVSGVGQESGLPSINAGLMGINISNPSANLHVSGDIRVGLVSQNYSDGAVTNVNRLGKIWFSGGPRLDLNSENGDDIWIGRNNFQDTVNNDPYSGQNVSEILVNIGEPEPSNPKAKFAIGYTRDNTWYEVMSMRVMKSPPNPAAPESIGGMEGTIGIGVTTPKTLFHIKGVADGDATVSKNYLVGIENSGSTNNAYPRNALAIKFTLDNMDATSNFITFIAALENSDSGELENTSIGSIEGNGIEGVQFSSPEADYAEYISKLDISEDLKNGDIVGVYSGKASKKTKNADHVMIMSSSPIIVGNWPGKQNESKKALIAFMGQAKVNVRGVVEAGDYIIPSGLNDGVGIAIKPDDIIPSQIDYIVGKAWESSNIKDIKKINAVVGFPVQIAALIKKLSQVHGFNKELDSIRKDNEFLEATFNEVVADRQKQINFLKAELKSINK